MSDVLGPDGVSDVLGADSVSDVLGSDSVGVWIVSSRLVTDMLTRS